MGQVNRDRQDARGQERAVEGVGERAAEELTAEPIS